VAGGTIAFVDPRGGGWGWGSMEGGRWEGEECDVGRETAVAGAVVGTAG